LTERDQAEAGGGERSAAGGLPLADRGAASFTVRAGTEDAVPSVVQAAG